MTAFNLLRYILSLLLLAGGAAASVLVAAESGLFVGRGACHGGRV